MSHLSGSRTEQEAWHIHVDPTQLEARLPICAIDVAHKYMQDMEAVHEAQMIPGSHDHVKPENGKIEEGLDPSHISHLSSHRRSNPSPHLSTSLHAVVSTATFA